MKKQIYVVGYEPKLLRKKHTNFWPWSYLTQTFKELGYNAQHKNASKIDHSVPHIYICWNEPDSLELIEKYNPHKDSIIIQKLTSFDTSPESQRDWTSDPLSFFKAWHWPQYQKLYKLKESGYEFYAFGAQTDIETFPIKHKIVSDFKDHIFWIPWGTMTIPHKQIMESEPILNNFKYDLGFVGSRWGTENRGNLHEWDNYLLPLVNTCNTPMLAGRGTKHGAVSVEKHIEILKQSKICPILHAASWKVEKGIMDRFWTVFSLGRFGVIDNEGILDFYDESEVVLAKSKEEYIDKSLYYMTNVNEQKPFIEKALSRIQSEYNQHMIWKKILSKIN